MNAISRTGELIGQLPLASQEAGAAVREARERCAHEPSWWAQWASALDAALTSLPLALVAVVIVYAAFPPHYLSSGVLATLLALALAHFVSAAGSRPIIHSARILESSTLAAMLHSVSQQLPAWGLAATPAVLMALMCLMGVVASLCCLLLYGLRADRFTRLIPAPVYAGFAISVAILLLISQSQQLWRLVQSGHPIPALVSMAIVTAWVALMARRWRPSWPSTALALLAGAATGWAWMAAGVPVATFMTANSVIWVLPVQLADFSALLSSQVRHTALVTSVLGNGSLIGLMVFINMSVANETVSRLDDRYASRTQQWVLSASAAFGALAGSVPLASSQQASAVALRHGRITAMACYAVGMICLLVAVLGLLNHMALVALAVIMLMDAWVLADRQALRLAWDWLRRRPLGLSQQQDLILIALVAGCAVVFNAIVAVLVGLIMGLMLFAVRHARKPVRMEWSGQQLHSNCMRSGAELSVLAGLGSRIRILELEAELFFGCVTSLEECLYRSLQESRCVILDWSRVRHVESSIALSLLRWQRAAKSKQVCTLHAGIGQTDGNVPAFFAQYLPDARCFSDLDRALEVAEITVMDSYTQPANEQARLSEDSMVLFKGLNSEQLELLQSLMPKRFVSAGDAVFQTGQSSDSMYLVLHGVAEVLTPNEQGALVRMASVGRGHVFGEVGFLDQAQRTATLVARKDLTLAEMTRQSFERLRSDKPEIVMQLLTNLTLDMAMRLRYTTQLVTLRQRVG